MLPALLTKCTPADAEIITREIVHNKLDWPELCDALHARFDKADYKVTLARNFASIAQGSGEPLRSYINRFRNSMQLLGYTDDNATLPDLFLKGVKQNIADEYEKHRRLEKASQLFRQSATAAQASSVDQPTHPPLQVIWDVCLEIEKNAQGRRHHDEREASSRDTRSSSSKPASGFKKFNRPLLNQRQDAGNQQQKKNDRDKKKCIVHPFSTHSDKECRRHLTEGSASSKGQQNRAAAEQDDKKKKVECHKCHRFGHYSNECRSKTVAGEAAGAPGGASAPAAATASSTVTEKTDYWKHKSTSKPVKSRKVRITVATGSSSDRDGSDDDTSHRRKDE
jgi:hypothetical protein